MSEIALEPSTFDLEIKEKSAGRLTRDLTINIMLRKGNGIE